MPLKTVVKVGNISNLSDARYCSGMGVDMLGFQVLDGHPQYMPAGLFQEIRGWIAGPKIVAEIYGIRSAEEIAFVMENYRPDYFELSDIEYLAWSSSLNLPCLVNMTKERPSNFSVIVPSGYLLVDETALQQLDGAYHSQPTLAKVTSPERVRHILDKYPVEGISFTASGDHSALSDILDALDES